MNRIIIIFSVLIMVSACKHETLIKNKLEKIECETGTIDFVNQVLPILESSCATSGCHDAKTATDGVILDNIDHILETGGINKGKATSSEMYKVLNETGNDKMPPSGSLTLEQKDIIKNWINQGAKYIECTNFEEDTILDNCDTTKFKFQDDIKPLIDGDCVACHSGTSASGGVKLETYTEVKVSVDNGKLSASVNHEIGTSAMPQGATKWDDCKLDKLRKWIEDGAQNN